MTGPEFRTFWAEVEGAASMMLGAHKWLGEGVDGTAHTLADPELQVRTLTIQPEYLKAHSFDGIRDFSEGSLPLARRFQVLKQ